MTQDASGGDKSEKASAQKLRKVREQGQVSRSRDWATAVGLMVSLQLLVALMPGYLEDFRALFGLGFAALDGEGALVNAGSQLFGATLALFVKMVAPLAVVPLLVCLASLYPGGWLFSGRNLAPRLDKLNPVNYVKRLFKMRHAIELATTVLKAAAVLVVLWRVCRGGVDGFLHLQSLPMNEAMARAAALMLDGVLALCTVFVLFALIDLPVQRMIFLREQRMTKREVKDEHKTSEGSPELRQRIRQLQMQMARRGARRTVPGADVVVVNPEHYAVALKYDEARAQAPFVVAKGVDEMALYIRQVAREHGVEVLVLPPLARALYRTSQVHQQIPVPLYTAVAQVLGHVLQIQAFREGRRASAPTLPAALPVPAHLGDPLDEAAAGAPAGAAPRDPTTPP